MPSTSSALPNPGHAPRRFVAALVIVPFLDAALGYLGSSWWLGEGTPQFASPQEPVRMVAGLAGGCGLFTMVTVAAPVRAWLIRRGSTSITYFALAGAAAGNLPFALYVWAVLLFALVHLVAGTLSDHLLPASDLLLGAAR